MKHQWNTNRKYDQHGQRMVAVVAESAIVFSDLSRNIDGVVPLGDFLKGQRLDRYTLEALVMTNYDFGNYSSGTATLEWD